MKRNSFIVGIVIVAGIVCALFSAKGLLTPYVSFHEAMVGDNYVQIMGNLVKSIPVLHDENGFYFYIEDEHTQRMRVFSRGVKPTNFEHADAVVVVGKFNTVDNVFEADKVLVKCPSKYKKETE